MQETVALTPEPAAIEVQDRLVRALAVLRVFVLLNALALNAYRWQNFDRPTVGLALMLVMLVWTGVAIWAYADHRRRTIWLLLADLAVAVATLMASPWAKGEEMRATVPGFWVMGALFAWAVVGRTRGGVVAALVLSAADLAVRDAITQANYGNVFLLMIGGPIVGYMCASLQEAAVARDRAERSAAAAAERARLARAVHDGVLQVLALVQRRGLEHGGELGELGRMAGEQEAALRTLIRQQDGVTEETLAGDADLAALVEEWASRVAPRVSVVTPGHPVPMPAARAEELVAAGSACLDNVTAHVGETAQAWVLLDDLGDQVTISVRDEGPGIAPGRLDEAADQGRLGVTESICGRLRELGGEAHLETAGWGTEWELTVPKRPPAL